MSLLRQVIQEVNQLRRQLDDQHQLIDGFVKGTREQIEFVRHALEGSQGGHDQRMLTALQQTDDSLKKALQSISQAETALLRIETI